MSAPRRVAVVGAGAAGLAAAWSAASAGARVSLWDAGAGATALAGGAVDAVPWDELAAARELSRAAASTEELSREIAAFSAALGCWRLPAAHEPCPLLATESGTLRHARGHDHALLALDALAPRARIVLPRVERADWDADALAHALAAHPAARAREFAFEPAPAELLRLAGEERIPAADLARRHDAEERLAFLAARVARVIAVERAAGRRVDAVLLGGWLGVERARAAELSARTGVACGEALATLGGASGLRFEAARARLLAELGVALTRARVSAVARDGDGWVVTAADEPPSARDAAAPCAAVVLATGGLASGGVRYDPAEHAALGAIPPAARTAFRLGLEAPVRIGCGGRALEATSSTHGPALDEVAWPSASGMGLLETVGVLCDARGATHARGLYVAGDARADRARTVLEAVASGVRAGARAATAERLET